MQARTRSVAGLLVLVAGAGMLTGCGAATARPTTTASSSHADPAAAVDLRRRALDELTHASRDENPQIRANAVEAAMLAHGELDGLIAAGLKDSNPGVRSVALMSIGRGRIAALAPRAQALLDDDSQYVRAAAIYALAACRRGVDQEPLADLLLNDQTMKVRSHAAFILGELGDSSALPLLRRAAKAKLTTFPPAEVNLFQLQLAEAMIKLGDHDQVESVRAALYPSRPEDFEAAILAVQIIGQVKDRGAIDQLVYLSVYKDRAGQPMPPEVRLQIAATLALLGLNQGGFIADEFVNNPSPTLRAMAAFVYGQTGKPSHLLKAQKLLSDPSPGVRVAAAAATLKLTENR